MALTLLEFVNRIGWEIDESEFNRAVNNVGKTVDKLKGPVGRLNLIVTGAFAAFTGLSTKAASDATEVQNKFNQTFGDMQDEANQFANQFAKSLNKVNSEVQESLSNFQALAVGLGFTTQESTQMSKRLQELVVDFGSFNNLSDADAQRRFISAMSGSSEVVDRYGINLKQANLELKLQELGLANSVAKANEMQKATARLAIIEESLGRQGALGDANRTLKDFASTTRGVRALIIRVAESFGEIIVPIANFVGKGLIVMLKVVEAIPAPLKAVILLLGLFTVLATNAAMAILVLTGILAALNGWLIKSGINLTTMTGAQIVNIATTKLQQFWTSALAIATKIYTYLAQRSAIVTLLGAFAMKIAAFASGLLGVAMKGLAAATTVASGGLTLIIPLIVAFIFGVITAIKAIKRGSGELGKFGKMFSVLFKAVKAYVAYWLFLPKLIWNLFDALSDIYLIILEPLFNMIRRVADPIIKAIEKIEKKFGSFEAFLHELMVRLLMPLARFELDVKVWSENISDWFDELFDSMVNSIEKFMNNPMIKKFTNFVDNIIGSDFVQGAISVAGRPFNGGGGIGGQSRVAQAGALALAGVVRGATNVNNTVQNTIVIENGMSAVEAENVIVRANTRSMQKMANDALRNTSGVD